MQGLWVQSLVREPRSHMSWSVTIKSVQIKRNSHQMNEIKSVSSAAQLCLTLRPHGLQHARLPCPSPTPEACSKSFPSSWWCHPAIPSSAVPSFSCLQSFPISGSFPMSQFFTSGGQRIRASVSVLPMNTQDWSPLGWTGWISLQSKGRSRVFSNTTVQKHWFLGTQPSLQSNSHPYMTMGKAQNEDK